MPLVVPVLRLAYLFLNVFETFKTLRLPPPSARNGGKPSVRAMSQRKRAMKGCMTVWLVWCCFAVYERTLDAIVRLFVPFYDELKSLVVIFFIITRSRGAEPIYLHVIRPVVKPYSATLDALLDLISSAGEVVVLLAGIPVHFVLAYYQRWTSLRRSRQAHGVMHLPPDRFMVSVGRSSGQQIAQPQPRAAQPARILRPRESADDRGSSGSRSSSRASSRLRSQPAQSRPAAHDIWYPPPSAYDDAIVDPPPGLPMDVPPPYASSESFNQEAAPVDEWRLYPEFPAAYPPTPLPPSMKLPPVNVGIAVPFSGIAEETMDGEERFVPSASMPLEKQGFPESLPSPRELSNPDSDGASSDDDKMHGIQADSPAEAVTSNDEEMDDEEESEDDFDVTLRTPFPRKRETYRKKDKTLVHSTSVESLASRSTGLSTTHHGSLRTRSSSETSTTLSLSDASSVAGRKRRLPPSEDRTPKNPRVHNKRTLVTKHPNPTAQTRTRGTGAAALSRANVRRNAVTAGAGADTLETESDDVDSGSSAAKRRRLADPAIRPTARRGDTERTIRAPSRAVKDSRLPQRRPLSHVVGGQDDSAAAADRKTAASGNKRKDAALTAERKTRSTSRR